MNLFPKFDGAISKHWPPLPYSTLVRWGRSIGSAHNFFLFEGIGLREDLSHRRNTFVVSGEDVRVFPIVGLGSCAQVNVFAWRTTE